MLPFNIVAANENVTVQFVQYGVNQYPGTQSWDEPKNFPPDYKQEKGRSWRNVKLGEEN
jgi:hypothetical protein